MPQDMYGTIAGLVKDYIQSVAATMMNERFNEMVQKANPPFVAAQASDGDFMISKTKGAWSVAALVKDNEVDSAMNGADNGDATCETIRFHPIGIRSRPPQCVEINMNPFTTTATNKGTAHSPRNTYATLPKAVTSPESKRNTP